MIGRVLLCALSDSLALGFASAVEAYTHVCLVVGHVCQDRSWPIYRSVVEATEVWLRVLMIGLSSTSHDRVSLLCGASLAHKRTVSDNMRSHQPVLCLP